MDGVTWNGSSFICNKHIEDGLVPWDLSETSYADREDYGISECEMDHADSPVVRPMTIILSDIARPAKQRGMWLRHRFRWLSNLPPSQVWPETSNSSTACSG